ncbi:DUF3592 domain-containing protein [Legionella cardiaca]|uniref:DUF3592 domain-containing protein n=1 Tax=Legionella cardiaca TaxID=1071983 RepID=A0ABY8ARI4_9GAMM|nr:DUF3592 domain-containing protein [Legionella cardiaca]WED43138.1 DUF3592 domain-containing protein [Legionella cardiaca]
MKQLTFFLVLATVATFLLAGYYLIEGWRFTHNSIQTDGKIVNFIIKPSQNNVNRAAMLHYPVVNFKTKTGKNVTATSQIGFYLHKYEMGDVVPLLYHEHDTNHVVIGKFIALWMRFAIVLIAALIFMILACITSLSRK